MNESKKMAYGEPTPSTSSSTSGSGAAGCDWTSLPPELQELILDYVEQKQKLLNLRLVNSNWKRVADTILERRTLSLWNSWDPSEPNDTEEKAECIYIRRLVYSEIKQEHRWNLAITSGAIRLRPIWTLWEHLSEDIVPSPKWDHYLPSTHNPKLGTPFPTNSLRVRFNNNIWPHNFPLKLRVQLFQAFVLEHSSSFFYLSSLLITNIQLNFSELTTILGQLGNLKALTLEEIQLDLEPRELEQGILPPLSKLTHLRVTSTTSNNASHLFVNAYCGQLISFETNSWIPMFNKPYQHLERLKLIADFKPENQFFRSSGPEEESYFPVLNSLSVIIHEEKQRFDWEELNRSIDVFPKTLTNLQLNIWMKGKNGEEEIESLASTGVTFPYLTELGISLPATFQHAECLRRVILPKFPELKCIYFIETDCVLLEGVELEEDEDSVEARVKAALEEMDKVKEMVYGPEFVPRVCPKLETIDV
ncbi:unnamed protein product [Orchesella dallaii]|uniref:F-box domain-containing protein n=1 Tax=Orchesella dallaii TaxID=48710 RepID=A0ABP1QVI0_9HEXA